GFGHGENFSGCPLMDQSAWGAQRKGPPRQAGRGKLQLRLDFLGNLIAQKQCPSAHKRESGPGGLSAGEVREARWQALVQPPVLQGCQEVVAAGADAFRSNTPTRVEPQ